MLLKIYKYAVSPFLPQACRFAPSCSEYMAEAVSKHGARGLVLAAKRLCRCNPFGGSGFDPVP